MSLKTEISEQYVLFVIDGKNFTEEEQKTAEKEVIQQFNKGMANYVFDLTKLASLDEAGVKLFAKINKVCQREHGILLIATTDENTLDALEFLLEEGVVCLPTVHEATEAVFMHDLENELKGEEDEEDMFGFGEPEDL